MARLVCESGPLSGREWAIEPGLTLGREAHNQVAMPENKKASRDHAKVWREAPGKYTVADLGSTNGTFVNDGKVARQPLVDGDEISIGEVRFRFVLDEADKPPAPKKREGPAQSLADVLSGRSPLATARNPGAATGGESGAAKIEVKERVLQYSKKKGKGSVASWDVGQSSGGTKWAMIAIALAVAAGLFFLVRSLVAG
jgi:pSer/pThr/pTyr-binding forkhead associated (FHA) protein